MNEVKIFGDLFCFIALNIADKMPKNFFAIFLFTFSTALLTPFPKYLDLSPSLNSTASKLPVDAPDGTNATPEKPPVCYNFNLYGWISS